MFEHQTIPPSVHPDHPFSAFPLFRETQDRRDVGIWVGHGHAPDFSPAGLPAPDWCAVVQALGPDGSNAFGRRDLSEAFKPGKQDAHLCMLEGHDTHPLLDLLWQQAKDNAHTHEEHGSGGAYCMWRLPHNRLVLGGFDNGGWYCAQTSIARLAHTLGPVALELSRSHFPMGVSLDITGVTLLTLLGEVSDWRAAQHNVRRLAEHVPPAACSQKPPRF